MLQDPDREIGYALGTYARESLGVKQLKQYSDPLYGQARRESLMRNFPALAEWAASDPLAVQLHTEADARAAS